MYNLKQIQATGWLWFLVKAIFSKYWRRPFLAFLDEQQQQQQMCEQPDGWWSTEMISEEKMF